MSTAYIGDSAFENCVTLKTVNFYNNGSAGTGSGSSGEAGDGDEGDTGDAPGGDNGGVGEAPDNVVPGGLPSHITGGGGRNYRDTTSGNGGSHAGQPVPDAPVEDALEGNEPTKPEEGGEEGGEGSEGGTTATPGSLAYLGNNAFKGCISINSISMPEITNAGVNAFYGWTADQTIELDNTADEIAELIANGTFDGCQATIVDADGNTVNA